MMKTKITTPTLPWRVPLLALLLTLLAMPTSLWADSQAYVRLSEDGKTLTFLYDEGRKDTDYNLDDYSSDGEDIPAWAQDNRSANVTKVVFDNSFAKASPTKCVHWFYEMANLTDIEGIENLNTSEVTDMSGMFYGCKGLTSLDLSTFNTSKVTSIEEMFEKCTSMISLDLSQFNTENVTDMTGLVAECYSLTSLDISSFDTKKVIYLDGMFYGCMNLTTLNLSSFNTQDVTSVYSMFMSCSSLASIFVSDSFVLSDECDDEDMFVGCTSLPGFNSQNVGKEMANADGGYFEKLDANATAWVGYDESTKTLAFHYDAKQTSISDQTYQLPTSATETPTWLTHSADVEKVVIDKSFANVHATSFHSWFEGMGKLANIEGLSYLNTSKTTDMSRMFYGCVTLSQLDLSMFNTTNVTTMNAMFENCAAFTLLDLTSFNTSKVTDMSRMFAGCSLLATIYASNKFSVADGCQGDNMFESCAKLPNFNTSNIGKAMATLNGYFVGKSIMWLEYQNDNKTMTFHYDSNMDNTTATYKYKVVVSNYPEWVDECAENVEKVVIDESFANARPTSCECWFYKMKNLSTIEGMENLNTSEVTSMGAMFLECEKLTSIDLLHFDTSNVTNMGGIFGYCESLKTIDLSRFNTSKVNDMETMFLRCKGLTSLDLSTFDTSNAADMNNMFDECSGLTTLDLSHFKTSNVTLMYNMFCGCTSLKDLNIKNFDTRNVTKMNCMFDNCSSLTELDLTHFDTSNVEDMVGMFSGCANLTKLNVSSFNTAKVTDMQDLFSHCPSLTELDLYSFDNSASKNNNYMFYEDSSLKNIYVSDKFKGDYQMFKGCTSLPNFDANKIGSEMANYKDGYLLKKVGTNGDDILGAKGETLTVASLPLADSKAFTLYENCKATEAFYSRDMTSTWGTLCLPYSINATASENTCRFYELQGVGENSIWLKEIENGTIAAGTPVLVCKKEDNQTTINVVGADADVVTEPVTADSNDRLVGTFDTKVLKDNSDCYFIAKNHFYKVSDYSAGNGVQVKPFRAYLQTITAARSSQLSIMDDATGINTLVDELNTTTKDCYDLNGRRTERLHKGINILRMSNGKTRKVIVK